MSCFHAVGVENNIRRGVFARQGAGTYASPNNESLRTYIQSTHGSQNPIGEQSHELTRRNSPPKENTSHSVEVEQIPARVYDRPHESKPVSQYAPPSRSGYVHTVGTNAPQRVNYVASSVPPRDPTIESDTHRAAAHRKAVKRTKPLRKLFPEDYPSEFRYETFASEDKLMHGSNTHASKSKTRRGEGLSDTTLALAPNTHEASQLKKSSHKPSQSGVARNTSKSDTYQRVSALTLAPDVSMSNTTPVHLTNSLSSRRSRTTKTCDASGSLEPKLDVFFPTASIPVTPVDRVGVGVVGVVDHDSPPRQRQSDSFRQKQGDECLRRSKREQHKSSSKVRASRSKFDKLNSPRGAHTRVQLATFPDGELEVTSSVNFKKQSKKTGALVKSPRARPRLSRSQEATDAQSGVPDVASVGVTPEQSDSVDNRQKLTKARRAFPANTPQFIRLQVRILTTKWGKCILKLVANILSVTKMKWSSGCRAQNIRTFDAHLECWCDTRAERQCRQSTKTCENEACFSCQYAAVHSTAGTSIKCSYSMRAYISIFRQFC